MHLEVSSMYYRHTLPPKWFSTSLNFCSILWYELAIFKLELQEKTNTQRCLHLLILVHLFLTGFSPPCPLSFVLTLLRTHLIPEYVRMALRQSRPLRTTSWLGTLLTANNKLSNIIIQPLEPVDITAAEDDINRIYFLGETKKRALKTPIGQSPSLYLKRSRSSSFNGFGLQLYAWTSILRTTTDVMRHYVAVYSPPQP